MANLIIDETATGDVSTELLSIPFIGILPQQKIFVNGAWENGTGTMDGTIKVYTGVASETLALVDTVNVNAASGTFSVNVDNYGATELKVIYTANSVTSVDLEIYDTRIS